MMNDSLGDLIPLKDMSISAQMSFRALHPELIKTTKINETPEYCLSKFRECYYNIIEILKEYCDLPKHYYPIISIWILGTYLHKEFSTYPLLFINATKGSGKSRLLRLISHLAWKGKLVADMRESSLFRTAKENSIFIDEFEGIGKKENATLRTLINAAYKKGVSVERMKKVKTKDSEEQVVESFQVYTPMAMANIWGIEDVLSDRCISFILEKSSDSVITKLIEDYEINSKIQGVSVVLSDLVYILRSVVMSKNITTRWNAYVKQKYTLNYIEGITTLNTHTTLNNEELSSFNKIDETGIDGRNLELFFPIFTIAQIIGEDIFDEMLKIAKTITDERKTEEYAESKDISLIDFVSHKEEWRGSFQSVYAVCQLFKLTTSEDPEEEKWVNARWVGRSLKRNKLILKKRRLGKGIEVMVDIDKAKQLLNRFKDGPHKTEVTS